MKLAKLKFKIIAELIVLAVVLLLIGIVFLITNSTEKRAKKEIKEINAKINTVQEKTNEFESKLHEINKYSLIFDNLDKKFRSTREIKISEANEIISKTKDRNNIAGLSVKINIPEKSEKKTHSRDRIVTYVTKGSIDFGAMQDIDALNFINDLQNSLPGYLIITDVDLKKAKEKITNEDLVAISRGEDVKIIEGKIKFIWYFHYDTKPSKGAVKQDQDNDQIEEQESFQEDDNQKSESQEVESKNNEESDDSQVENNDDDEQPGNEQTNNLKQKPNENLDENLQ